MEQASKHISTSANIALLCTSAAYFMFAGKYFIGHIRLDKSDQQLNCKISVVLIFYCYVQQKSMQKYYTLGIPLCFIGTHTYGFFRLVVGIATVGEQAE